MSGDNETSEERRERLRQKELKYSSIRGSNLSDLVGGLGWKGTGVMILVLILAAVIYSVFFR